jgi:murein DD-endopeptidase MepM/ murein hydrolase activator NlpD
VVAAAEGDVDFVGDDEVLGKYVEIRHGDDWVTVYGHCASINVGPGHHVRAGEQVAKMGRTGRAETAQLHFQVWQRGEAVDPRKLLSGEPAPR